ncbi:hypothetical protein AAU01_20940 [Paenarthrobacter aurescens]|uniref:Uncharacterized protein n=1 Tax=Paenarthrobacter aurescens TaxID=43663 RepID=A0A4Y3NKV4_PAEAU|nr:hypothetical protein AAU01_20940 [Paenarthrobacter aurescens]
MDTIPGGPSAHGTAAPGRCAKNLANPATTPAQVPAIPMGTTASHGRVAAKGTARVPKIVTGATNGPATTLAMSA